MVSLTEQNRIQVPTGGFEDATFIFPSFVEMAADIVRLQKRKLSIEGGNVANYTNQERIRMFDRHCIAVEDLPARKDGELVALSDLDDWKAKVPAPSKIAAASPFDEPAAKIIEPEAFGDPLQVEIDAIVGKVRLAFPPVDGSEMSKALARLMEDRIRQKGRRIQDNSFDVRMRFFAKVYAGADGIDAAKAAADDIPANWIVAACRCFEVQEALSDDDLGN